MAIMLASGAVETGRVRTDSDASDKVPRLHSPAYPEGKRLTERVLARRMIWPLKVRDDASKGYRREQYRGIEERFRPVANPECQHPKPPGRPRRRSQEGRKGQKSGI